MVAASISLLQSAMQTGLPYESAEGVLVAADDGMSGYVTDILTVITSTLGVYGSLAASQLFGGQSVVHVLSNCRLTTTSISGGASNVSVPRTVYEELQVKNTSTIHFLRNQSYATDMKVTVAEFKAKLLGDDKPYLSNPLRIQIFELDSLSTANTSHLRYVILVQLSNIAPPVHTSSHNFTSECGKASLNVSSFTCPDSGRVLTHNCTGRVGTLVSFYRPSCQTLSQNSSSTGASSTCVLANYTSSFVTCICTIYPASSRRLSDVSTIAARSGALQLVAMTELVSKDFLNTFSAAPSLSTAAGIQKALIVIMMFASLWALGIGLGILCGWRKHRRKGTNKKCADRVERMKRGAQASQSPLAVQQYLVDYVSEIFPAVFQKTSRVYQLVQEIRIHHRYLSLLFSAETGPRADRERVLTAAEVLTTQTLLMFLLALLYDLQSPSDDLQARAWVGAPRESSCLARRAVLDSSQSTCRWRPRPAAEGYSCSYRDPDLTVRTVLVIAVMVSVFTGPFLRPIQYLFGLVAAPTADAAKVDKVTRAAEDKVLTAVRRASMSIGNAARSVMRVAVERAQPKKVAGTESRSMPTNTAEAQELARASICVIASTADRFIERHKVAVLATKHLVRSGRGIQDEDESNSAISNRSRSDEASQGSGSDSGSDPDDHKSDGSSEDGERAVEVVSKKGSDPVLDPAMKTHPLLSVATPVLFEELAADIALQRRFLHSSELEAFDSIHSGASTPRGSSCARRDCWVGASRRGWARRRRYGRRSSS